MECYETCPEILKESIGIEVGHSQMQRLVDTYGKELGKMIAVTRALPPLRAKDVLYAEVDGSMIFTREDS